MINIPFRIDVAGGWMDQPMCSSIYPGSVITLCIEPTINFNNRSGMATSTRAKAIDLFDGKMPTSNFEKWAKVLFCYDNLPGTKIISGAQDSIGITMPGLNKSNYVGNYWPQSIDQCHNDNVLDWLEKIVCLVPLDPREKGYDVLCNTDVVHDKVEKLSFAAKKCWSSILAMDIVEFGKNFTASMEAQVAMFPNMLNESMREKIQQYENCSYGHKISGAGGGGYIILITDQEIEGSIKIKVRRKEYYGGL